MATTTLCSNLLRLSAFPDFKAGSHTSISKCTLCAIPGRQVVKACERNVLIARIASPPACPRRKSTCRASSGSDDVLKDEVAGEADELIGEASISTSAAASEADEKVVSEELRSSGAVVFKRSSAQSHFEFATTLEKLDLAKLSSELSRESANRMGLQVEGDGAQAETPVEVLIDVEKDGRNLRLEGIANTAITVKCNT